MAECETAEDLARTSCGLRLLVTLFLFFSVFIIIFLLSSSNCFFISINSRSRFSLAVSLDLIPFSFVFDDAGLVVVVKLEGG